MDAQGMNDRGNRNIAEADANMGDSEYPADDLRARSEHIAAAWYQAAALTRIAAALEIVAQRFPHGTD